MEEDVGAERRAKSAHILALFSVCLDRVDPQDRGGEYRSLIGLPGGKSHPVYPGLEAAAERAGFQLVPGEGSDPDTLRKQIVYVYDTAQFPFYPGEVYHQYRKCIPGT